MKYKPTYSDKQRDAARQRKEEERKRNVQEEAGERKTEKDVKNSQNRPDQPEKRPA